MVKRLLPVLVIALLLTGCATTTITNLTAKQTLRNDKGLYPVEVALASRQQTMRWPTIKANAVMENEVYTMRLTSLMTNRWEGLVPVPSNANIIHYRYKFDYNYNAVGAPGSDSVLSKEYSLRILDK